MPIALTSTVRGSLIVAFAGVLSLRVCQPSPPSRSSISALAPQNGPPVLSVAEAIEAPPGFDAQLRSSARSRVVVVALGDLEAGHVELGVARAGPHRELAPRARGDAGDLVAPVRAGRVGQLRAEADDRARERRAGLPVGDDAAQRARRRAVGGRHVEVLGGLDVGAVERGRVEAHAAGRERRPQEVVARAAVRGVGLQDRVAHVEHARLRRRQAHAHRDQLLGLVGAGGLAAGRRHERAADVPQRLGPDLAVGVDLGPGGDLPEVAERVAAAGAAGGVGVLRPGSRSPRCASRGAPRRRACRGRSRRRRPACRSPSPRGRAGPRRTSRSTPRPSRRRARC